MAGFWVGISNFLVHCRGGGESQCGVSQLWFTWVLRNINICDSFSIPWSAGKYKRRRKQRLIRVNVICDAAVYFSCYCNDFSATTMEGDILQMLLLIHEIKIKSDDLGSCFQTVFIIFTVTLLLKRMKAGTWHVAEERVCERETAAGEIWFEISSIINFCSTSVTPEAEAGKWVARKILELIAVIRKICWSWKPGYETLDDSRVMRESSLESAGAYLL